MKVLFISNADLPDFQNDMIFHGLRTLLGGDCIDYNEMWYMYKDTKDLYWNERVPNNGKSYGNGFTLYGKLENLHIDRTDIQSKIRNKYFNKIIYGSVKRCTAHLQEIIDTYDYNDIIFIDGEDDTSIRHDLLKCGIYYKRELIHNETYNLRSINFCIPEELIIKEMPKKIKDYGTVIPGDFSTYIFETETDYFDDYQKSYYGVTTKKGGWDCLRHYEILMNGCMPYFPDLHLCPKQTMSLFPKTLIVQNNLNMLKGLVPEIYEAEIQRLLDYTRKYLTTTYVAKTLLK